MAKLVRHYSDNAGRPHNTLRQATVSDLSEVLGNYAFATDVMNKRKEIEEIFRQHDAAGKPDLT